MNFTATISSKWPLPRFLRITLRVLLLHCTRPIVWGGEVLMPIMCFCIWDDNKKSPKTAMGGLMTTHRKERWPRTELQEQHPGWTNRTKCNSLSSYMPTLLLGWHTDLCTDTSVSLKTSHSAVKEKVNLHPITAEATSPKKCIFIFF